MSTEIRSERHPEYDDDVDDVDSVFDIQNNQKPNTSPGSGGERPVLPIPYQQGLRSGADPQRPAQPFKPSGLDSQPLDYDPDQGLGGGDDQASPQDPRSGSRDNKDTKTRTNTLPPSSFNGKKEYEIWGGMAYCLQMVETLTNQELRERGFVPSLAELKKDNLC